MDEKQLHYASLSQEQVLQPLWELGGDVVKVQQDEFFEDPKVWLVAKG